MIYVTLLFTKRISSHSYSICRYIFHGMDFHQLFSQELKLQVHQCLKTSFIFKTINWGFAVQHHPLYITNNNTRGQQEEKVNRHASTTANSTQLPFLLLGYTTKSKSCKPEMMHPIRLGYLTKLFWMMMPYSHQRPVTTKVVKMRGNGSTSQL